MKQQWHLQTSCSDNRCACPLDIWWIYSLLSGSLITQTPRKTKFKSDANCLQSSADLCIQLSPLKPNGKKLWLRKLYMKFTSAIRKIGLQTMHLKKVNPLSFSNLVFPLLSLLMWSSSNEFYEEIISRKSLFCNSFCHYKLL